ncbi:AzlD domain-containing protein [Heyndrickxia ginsengihumi]|uniref:AzlD domain-containing protein n=1 Tax=Heyndrickxia ginsengihumi TaxID=363870 RepID=A0A0A6V8Q4_9BACI|nr:AzlD domain-containing protein [Heyndrickxia ginsengihumi]KHD84435.1 branched-chain amino acid transporter AzlD [Heyndrickxia ginsengihumi]MBE6184043.1 AzlD domain-containing protein [Bacillus sp. (in: firmicutes)]MCM3024563.1 AzlD domain-containing protein [Heyndrickxia ginsengihumi]NEY18772.1 AzlD domain-containing protein [Heyndrickxia ginsengihumi]
MNADLTVLLIILGCTLVTFIPRVVPFLLVRNVRLSEPVLKWLSFVPICILTALVVNSFIIQTNHYSLNIDWTVIIVLVPTLFVALKTKSLSATVIIGVILMALLRLVIKFI